MVATLAERLGPLQTPHRPGLHLGLTWRRASLSDLEELKELVRVTEEQNHVIRRTRAEQVETIVTQCARGDGADAIVGLDMANTIQAFGVVMLYREDQEVARAELFAATMPHWRGRGIGRALLHWQDARARQLLIDEWGADSLIPARISNVVEAHQRDRRQLYAAAGFSPTAFIGVYRHDVHTIAPLPAGNSTRPWNDEDEDAVRALHAEKAQREGASQAQAQRWWKRVRDHLDPTLSCVSDEDGHIKAYALVCRHTDAWLSGGPTDASIEAIGPDNDEALSVTLHATCCAAHAQGMQALSTETQLTSSRDTDPYLEELGFDQVGLRMVFTIDV